MKKILVFLFLTFLSITSNAEDIPNPNDKGIKKVNGTIVEKENVNASKKRDMQIDDPIFALIDDIVNTNYVGFPIYHVKVSDVITLNVGSRESFKTGDCVLVWYDGAMGDSPDLSMPGQAGIARDNACNK